MTLKGSEYTLHRCDGLKPQLMSFLSAVDGARFVRLMCNLYIVLHGILSASTAEEEISSVCNCNSFILVRGIAEISS